MSILSGTAQAISGGISSSKAARAQEQPTKEANLIQAWQYAQNRKDLMPFMDLAKRGGQDYEKIRTEGPGAFEQSDYYKTMVGAIDEGADALVKRGLATGTTGTRTMKGMARYGLDQANKYRGQFMNEWAMSKLNPAATQAGMGQIGQMANVTSNTAANMGSNVIAGGQARASGYLGRNMAINQGIGTIQQGFGNYMLGKNMGMIQPNKYVDKALGWLGFGG